MMGAVDQVIANSYVDAIRSISVRQTWEFVPPDTLILDLSLAESGLNGGGKAKTAYK